MITKIEIVKEAKPEEKEKGPELDPAIVESQQEDKKESEEDSKGDKTEKVRRTLEKFAVSGDGEEKETDGMENSRMNRRQFN